MDFKERFKGRTSTMNKEGVLGIIASSGKPIEKPGNTNKTSSDKSSVPIKPQSGKI